MLMRADPFRELDRRAQRVTGAGQGTWARPTPVPTDAYREGDTLDTERIEAEYAAGVPTPRIPVAERAEPRRIAIGNADGERTSVGSATADRT